MVLNESPINNKSGPPVELILEVTEEDELCLFSDNESDDDQNQA